MRSLGQVLALSVVAAVLCPVPAHAEPRSEAHSTTKILAGRHFVVVPLEHPGERTAGAVTYTIMIERTLSDRAAEFSAKVDAVLGDARGWNNAGLTLVRVNEGADVTVLLAKPSTVDKLCAPLNTGGVLSCTARRRAVLNFYRWTRGAASWPDDLDGYRGYLINHEVGHLLGARHVRCPAPGQPAPVMMQQTKRVTPCVPSNTPRPSEIAALKATRARRAKRRRR